MKKLKTFIASIMIAAFGFMAVAPVATVGAYNPFEEACTNSPDNQVCDEVQGASDESALIGIIVNTLLFIVGLLSVVMIIFAGIQYTTSTGDSGRVSKAKNTLLYAIVGLIISFLAFALVNWVFKLF